MSGQPPLPRSISDGRTVLRSLAVWLAFMCAESVLGMLRAALLVPRVGNLAARQIGILPGMAAIFCITFLSIRWIGAKDRPLLIRIGILWAVLTFGFEVLLGRFVMNVAWNRILEDYRPQDGGLMGFGLLFLVFCPWLAERLRQRQAG